MAFKYLGIEDGWVGDYNCPECKELYSVEDYESQHCSWCKHDNDYEENPEEEEGLKLLDDNIQDV